MLAKYGSTLPSQHLAKGLQVQKQLVLYSEIQSQTNDNKTILLHSLRPPGEL